MDIMEYVVPKWSEMEVEQKVLKRFGKSLSFSWLGKNILGKVKDQGPQDNCWAFMPLNAMESRWKLQLPIRKRKRSSIDLAPQQLIDCMEDRERTNQFVEANEYARTQGIVQEKDYPYTGERSICGCNDIKSSRRFFVRRHQRVDEKNLKEITEAIRQQPVSCGYIDSIEKIAELEKHKTGEIFKGSSLKKLKRVFRGNVKKWDAHAFLIVGYGRDKGRRYYLVKNTWDLSWGYFGYGRISCDTWLTDMYFPTQVRLGRRTNRRRKGLMIWLPVTRRVSHNRWFRKA